MRVARFGQRGKSNCGGLQQGLFGAGQCFRVEVKGPVSPSVMQAVCGDSLGQAASFDRDRSQLWASLCAASS